jgi:hypothetical protein
MVQVCGHEESVLFAFPEKFVFGPVRDENGKQQGRDEDHHQTAQ